MKPLSITFCIAVAFLAAAAFGDSDDQKKAFAKLKTLDGTWQGTMKTTPPSPGADGTKTTVTMRVASMGNILMHEMKGEGRPDNPITMFYLDDARLVLTHYCDAGNRPRMSAKTSPDGKTIEFDFIDVAGGTKYGYMRRAVFTLIDADHHIEEWTYMMPGEKPIVARVEFKRVGDAAQASAGAEVHQHGM
ncbi:MAG TPA: hypothetical protein VFT12_07210 [Thermoanaerobaculia bacterium]|nr:hypothetical protein [Thermoanaerobaculia bacterium]